MNVFTIIFWVVIVETFLGHLPFWAPFIALGVCLVVEMVVKQDKRKEEAKLRETFKKIKERHDKRKGK
jgi:hypothetical protein